MIGSMSDWDGWVGTGRPQDLQDPNRRLSLCWAKAHGMSLMVQDLTNPMLAQIPHALLGHHAGTIMGVESNGMQFIPKPLSERPGFTWSLQATGRQTRPVHHSRPRVRVPNEK